MKVEIRVLLHVVQGSDLKMEKIVQNSKFLKTALIFAFKSKQFRLIANFVDFRAQWKSRTFYTAM